MGRKGRATSAKTRQRQAEAARLRLNGDTLQQIADKLKYKHPQCAKHAIEAYYRKYTIGTPEQRETIISRNETMIAQLYNEGRGTPLEAILGILKIQHQNMMLLGIGGSNGNGGTTINNVIGAFAAGGAAAVVRCADWTESGVAGELRTLADDSRRVNAEDCTPALEAGPEGGGVNGDGPRSPSQGPTPGAFGSVPGIVDD